MKDALESLQVQLNLVGKKLEQVRCAVDVNSVECIDSFAPSTAGVYWIETTMPVADMASAISIITGHKRGIRKTEPEGVGLIEQIGNEFYVVYSGTHDNIRTRLRQHLFNEGSTATAKLGCIISHAPFSNFKWRIGFVEIDSYELRYALEAWWRLKIGWPAFCRR